jgi:tryptophanyl-tRNA synthetase
MRQKGSLSYAELKEQLTDDVLTFLKPVQKTYGSLMKDRSQLCSMLDEGAKKARPVAQETVSKAKKALGLD